MALLCQPVDGEEILCGRPLKATGRKEKENWVKTRKRETNIVFCKRKKNFMGILLLTQALRNKRCLKTCVMRLTDVTWNPFPKASCFAGGYVEGAKHSAQ